MKIFLSCLAAYILMSYGGIRSPDSEIVFLTAQSLAGSSSFALDERTWWKEFGVARGQDGQNYSLFGPAESLLLVPFVITGEYINRSGWYQKPGLYISPSHYVNSGLHDFLLHREVRNRQPHALRLLASPFNAIISALGSLIFWGILMRLGFGSAASGVVTVLYAFGTLAWPYSGTFFSEPLATMLVLLSFLLLIPDRSHNSSTKSGPLFLAASGLALGLGTAAHITALMFLPFFLLLSAGLSRPPLADLRVLLRPSLQLMAGFFIPALFLGAYNFTRFDSIFETGRRISGGSTSTFDYVSLVLPFEGLYGLILSSGKGLLIYCPAVLIGFFAWRHFHRRNAFLSSVLALAILARIAFISIQEDWYGGFSLGPRYLVMAIPFMLLPAASWLSTRLEQRDILALRCFFAVTFVSISQQIYFCIGEIFSFFHIAKIPWQNTTVDWNKILYFNWKLSPLLNLLKGERGPFLLQAVPVGNSAIWLMGTLFVMLVLIQWHLKLADSITT